MVQLRLIKSRQFDQRFLPLERFQRNAASNFFFIAHTLHNRIPHLPSPTLNLFPGFGIHSPRAFLVPHILP
jgi:hypothetical protein